MDNATLEYLQLALFSAVICLLVLEIVILLVMRPRLKGMIDALNSETRDLYAQATKGKDMPFGASAVLQRRVKKIRRWSWILPESDILILDDLDNLIEGIHQAEPRREQSSFGFVEE